MIKVSKLQKIMLFTGLSILIIGTILTITVATIMRGPVKEAVVVKIMTTSMSSIIEELDEAVDRSFDKINLESIRESIDKSFSKIDSSLDKINNIDKTVNDASNILSALNISGTEKYTDRIEKSNDVAGKVQREIDNAKNDIVRIINEDITAEVKLGVEKEVSQQMSDQLGISKKLTQQIASNPNLSVFRKSDRQITTSIYRELEKSSSSIVVKSMSTINDYFIWISVMIVSFVSFFFLFLGSIFIYIAVKIQECYITCPYCKKSWSRKISNIVNIFKGE
ncbi:MAG: hypothetical protein JJV93_02270 [Alphaproteobacteria bacterium]|nr:hypothetical protein [Alphaproteobacteria bacterium]